ncbi:MAG: formamidopyrimidine-DNA glycosylase [Planctomycetes bacterium]|nr:formamidopyrimidine-DNA glycosylase [Planctomycetota bacterium]
MPELPDVTLYVEALEQRIRGRVLENVRLKSAFLVRSAVPPLASANGRSVTGLRRLGKRIVLALGPRPDGSRPPQLHLLLHLMIAGRLHWKARGAALTRRTDLAAFDFDAGSLVLTEAGTKKRASLYVLADEAGLATHDRGGLEPLECALAPFAERLAASKHTLKRALCDPRCLSGVGNAYSDEILHRARLSPLRLARQLDSAEMERLHAATQAVLREWLQRLRAQAGERFPEKVTAFRPEMAVHGRFGQPCPVCAAPVQRIVRAENEVNYCARCQTGGKLLKDRALSVLLKDDWPSTLEELEERGPPGP